MRCNTTPASICLNRIVIYKTLKNIWWFISGYLFLCSLRQPYIYYMKWGFVRARKSNSLLQHFNLMIKNSLDLRKTKRIDERINKPEYQTAWQIQWIYDRKMTSTRFSMLNWNPLNSINLWSCTGPSLCPRRFFRWTIHNNMV